MLWYKAWLETRSRFFIALAICVAFCVQMVLVFPGTQSPNKPFLNLDGIHQGLVFVWLLGVTLLMMGGLLREKAAGSSSFTLSLPVSRLHLISVRVGMGLMQAIALAIVPWIAMLLAANLETNPNALFQVSFHVVLLVGGGVFFLAVSLLISSLVEGEYTAPVVNFGMIIMLVYALANKKVVGPYSPWAFMMGLEYFYRRTPLVLGPILWLHVATFMAVAALLVLVSVKVIQHRDF